MTTPKNKRGRPAGPKTRCNGQWTEARFKQFIFSLLRQGTRKWAPKNDIRKEARVGRGLYKCKACGNIVPPTVPVVKDGKRKRVTNIFVDHIEPIVDPNEGFTTFDTYINNMFCEKDNLQLLCKDCHNQKTKKEREVASGKQS